MKRIYLPLPLDAGATLPLPEPVQHRLFRVMRMGMGDRFVIFNGQGALAQAEITDAKCRHVRLTDMLPPKPALPPLTLAIGVPKREAWETVLRQATEMGVTRIVPLKTRFSQIGKLNTARADAIMVEAAEQCEREDLPTLLPLLRLEDFLDDLTAPCMWAYERLDPATAATSAPATALLIGPEGGFAPDEVAVLRTHPHVQARSLGPTILRADTAVVAGLARLALG